MKRFIIAGTHSGCGKTTVSCAILSALKQRSLSPAAFKCGPDYIDPMFHREAIGVDSHNLDSFFCSGDTLLHILDRFSAGHDVSVIEGVMGFYDGDSGSAHTVSELTETPAVIVINSRGMSDSMGAVMSGFLGYRKNRIAGFIFDRLPEKLIPLAERLCRELGTEYLGCLPECGIMIESRHLGLVTAGETPDIQEKLRKLGELAEKNIRLDRLMELADAPVPEYTAPAVPEITGEPVIAVASDRAFCFTYPENTDLLERMGCTIKYFSPLTDSAVPEADGLILPGGYPELYAKELSENRAMLESVRAAAKSGMPVIAECGGFMYLHDSLTLRDGASYPMAGVISGNSFYGERLKRFGYITVTAGKDSMLCAAGDSFPAHEFHYWDSDSCGDAFTAVKPDGRSWECGHAGMTMYAGFPHLYLYSCISAAERFARACVRYRERRGRAE